MVPTVGVFVNCQSKSKRIGLAFDACTGFETLIDQLEVDQVTLEQGMNLSQMQTGCEEVNKQQFQHYNC